MSKIEVDTIEPQSGTSLTIGASGDTVTVPSGATLDMSSGTMTLNSTMTNTPAFYMYANSDTTCTAGSVTKITLGGTYYDTDSATSNSRFTVPSGKGGKYLIGGEISLGDTTNSVHMAFYVNGSHSYDSLNWWQDFGDALSGVSRTVVIDLSAGDYVELYCLVDGTTRGLNAEKTRTKLFGHRLIGA